MSSKTLDDQALLSTSSSQVLIFSDSRLGEKRKRCTFCLVAIGCICFIVIFLVVLALVLTDPRNHRPWLMLDDEEEELLDKSSKLRPPKGSPLGAHVPVVEDFSMQYMVFDEVAPIEELHYVKTIEQPVNISRRRIFPKVADPEDPKNGSLCWEVLDRFDCFPGKDASQHGCEQRGCCWRPPDERHLEKTENGHLGVPYCFYPIGYSGYQLVDYHVSPTGFSGLVQRYPSSIDVYPSPIPLLRLDVIYETPTRLRVKLIDNVSPRYEVPFPNLPNPPNTKPNNRMYTFNFTTDPFTFKVHRKDTGRILFDTSAGSLLYYDQFLEISSYLPTRYIYGLGEHSDRLLHSIDYSRLTFFATDVEPGDNEPLYGAHPFYLSLEGDGRANGVFLFNSNALDVILSPAPAITYRSIGGVLDFYYFLGPSPKDVVQQYMELVGKPALPPYWALGFHLCKYGYGSLNKTKEVMERNIAAGIPLDVQWNDIDYMIKSRDFTYNQDTFSGLPDFVKSLHDRDMHYVIITDPGISAAEPPGTYAPYDEGVAGDIFLKNASNSTLMGRVWTGDVTAYPDFTHPNASAYWTKQIRSFHDQLPFDGLWIDMNEPSNFVDGSVDGCPNSSLESPPYSPHLVGNSLKSRTVCMTAQHSWGLHYNLHNLYGITEAAATQTALLSVRLNKRPFIISRSTFAGHGKYSGHWTGDIPSTWEALQRSIPGILNFNMYGVPLVGADICGFNGNTTEELCQRWQQVGAFYPFSRNHNSLGQVDQDPAAFGPEMVASSRVALQIRYRLLPYYYYLFFRASLSGGTVVRPMFFQFPTDLATYEIDWQFLVGSAVMISPVLTPGTTELLAYFPAGRWYDFYTGEEVKGVGQRELIRVDAPLDKINIHIFGGSIIPTQKPEVTTAATRRNPFQLLVALGFNGTAAGEMYWDDGEQYDVLLRQNYSLVQFHMKQNILCSKIVTKTFLQVPLIDDVMVFGMGRPKEVLIHDERMVFAYDEKYKVVIVKSLELDSLTVFCMRFVF